MYINNMNLIFDLYFVEYVYLCVYGIDVVYDGM